MPKKQSSRLFLLTSTFSYECLMHMNDNCVVHYNEFQEQPKLTTTNFYFHSPASFNCLIRKCEKHNDPNWQLSKTGMCLEILQHVLKMAPNYQEVNLLRKLIVFILNQRDYIAKSVKKKKKKEKKKDYFMYKLNCILTVWMHKSVTWSIYLSIYLSGWTDRRTDVQQTDGWTGTQTSNVKP